MPQPLAVFVSQVYVPDPAAVGQHVADAAVECARRGWRVIVYTSARGYERPEVRYPRRETLHGVEVRRLPWGSLGKRRMSLRMVAALLFVLQAALHVLLRERPTVVVTSTAPPFAGIVGWLARRLRGARSVWWVMDLNPDQLLATGRAAPRSLIVRVQSWVNRRTVSAADDIVVLDRFMRERVAAIGPTRARVHVIPPWPLDDHLTPVPHPDNGWRAAQGLDGRFVVMYSGNHTPSNPLTTLLEAAEALADDPRFAFVFVGGGVGKREVEACGAPNVRSLPYQPLETLAESLSAADLHVVSLGDRLVGIVHPCKVYGAMAVARPVLLLGPRESHVGDMLAASEFGWRVAHGDAAGLVTLLRRLADAAEGALMRAGSSGKALVEARFSKARLCGALADVVAPGGGATDARDGVGAAAGGRRAGASPARPQLTRSRVPRPPRAAGWPPRSA